MSDDSNDLRTDNPEDSETPEGFDSPDVPQVVAADEAPLPVMVPNTEVDVPEVTPGSMMNADDLPDPASVYAPGGPGSTALAKLGDAGGTAGIFIFINGYPLFLPKDIAEGLAKFILKK